MTLISEYKEGLRLLRKQHRSITSKRYKTIVDGKKTTIDDRTSIEMHDQKILAEAISSTEYALFWLQNGHEKQWDEANVTDLSKDQRTQLWGDLEALEAYCDIKLQDDNKRELTPEEKEIVNEVWESLNHLEKEVFYSIYGLLNTQEQTADYLHISERMVKYSVQKIKNKIDYYNNVGLQMSLFS